MRIKKSLYSWFKKARTILLLEKTINNLLGNIIIRRDWGLNSCFSSLLSVVVQFGVRYNILHPALNLHLISSSEVASLFVPPVSGFSKLEVSQSGWPLKIHECAECWVMGGWYYIRRTPMVWHWLQLGTGAIIPFGCRKKHLSVSLLFPKLESASNIICVKTTRVSSSTREAHEYRLS
jgi:hypothetical protein